VITHYHRDTLRGTLTSRPDSDHYFHRSWPQPSGKPRSARRLCAYLKSSSQPSASSSSPATQSHGGGLSSGFAAAGERISKPLKGGGNQSYWRMIPNPLLRREKLLDLPHLGNVRSVSVHRSLEISHGRSSWELYLARQSDGRPLISGLTSRILGPIQAMAGTCILVASWTTALTRRNHRAWQIRSRLSGARIWQRHLLSSKLTKILPEQTNSKC